MVMIMMIVILIIIKIPITVITIIIIIIILKKNLVQLFIHIVIKKYIHQFHLLTSKIENKITLFG